MASRTAVRQGKRRAGIESSEDNSPAPRSDVGGEDEDLDDELLDLVDLNVGEDVQMKDDSASGAGKKRARGAVASPEQLPVTKRRRGAAKPVRKQGQLADPAITGTKLVSDSDKAPSDGS
jgi:hypothetical protein